MHWRSIVQRSEPPSTKADTARPRSSSGRVDRKRRPVSGAASGGSGAAPIAGNGATADRPRAHRPAEPDHRPAEPDHRPAEPPSAAPAATEGVALTDAMAAVHGAAHL